MCFPGRGLTNPLMITVVAPLDLDAIFHRDMDIDSRDLAILLTLIDEAFHGCACDDGLVGHPSWSADLLHSDAAGELAELIAKTRDLDMAENHIVMRCGNPAFHLHVSFSSDQSHCSPC